MIKKTLYFGNPAYLSLSNRQLVIKLPAVENAKDLPDIIRSEAARTVPIEDIGVVVLDNRQITVTQGALAALLDNNAALVTCNDKHMPAGLFMPLQGNSVQNERFRSQLEASQPLLKQLWQQTVRAKIENQAAVLQQQYGKPHKTMLRLAASVRSGDPDNCEAQAAAYYWKNVFKDNPRFIRDREGDPPNNLLNYGYAILRAVVARALVSSGLLPIYGIHHHNRYNDYCLADDIMEPYRPFVDMLVIDIAATKGCQETLNTDIKRDLLAVPVIDVTINGSKSPLMVATALTAASVARCFASEARKIVYPSLQ